MIRTVMLAAAMILALGACHKRGAEADGAASRGLQVEAYDPPIPKAPLKGRLETLAHHPEDAGAASSTASSEAPAESAQGPAAK